MKGGPGARMEEPERGQNGPPAGVCPADDRRARRAVCAPVVHRRRGIAQVRGSAPAEVEGAFEEGLGFDGSSIEGLARVFESDMLAQPDPATFQILPWRGETEGNLTDVLRHPDADGEPSAADPRNVLKRTLAKAADMGFTCYTHPEIEFYLLKSQEPGPDGSPVPVDEGGYFDHVPAALPRTSAGPQ